MSTDELTTTSKEAESAETELPDTLSRLANAEA
jgi:hypothetical protein